MNGEYLDDLGFDINDLDLDGMDLDSIQDEHQEEKGPPQPIPKEQSQEPLQEPLQEKEDPQPIPQEPTPITSKELLKAIDTTPDLPYSEPFAEYHVRANLSSSTPLKHKMAVVKQEMANAYSLLAFEESNGPLKSGQINEMIQRLDRHGFCIVELATFNGLVEKIHTEVNSFQQTPSCLDYCNVHASFDFYGLASKNKTFLNPNIFQPQTQYLVTSIVPMIQQLIKAKSSRNYPNHQQWLANAQFPWINPKPNGGDADEKAAKKRGRPKVDMAQGTDVETALYFTPYFNEYWHALDLAKANQTPLEKIKYPNEMEHLQVLASIGSPNSCSFTCALGMHKGFDLLMDMIRNHELSVETGGLAINPTHQCNPTPMANTYYRIAEPCIKEIFGSFLLKMIIPPGCVAIISPKVAIGREVGSGGMILPLSVFPKPHQATISTHMGQIRYSEFKTWQVAIPPLDVSAVVEPLGCYQTSRRAFYRHYGRSISRVKDDDQALNQYMESVAKMAAIANNKVLENYLIYGFPNSYQMELYQSNVQEYLASILPAKNEYELLCQQIEQLSLASQTEKPVVGLVSHYPPCQSCGQLKPILSAAQISIQGQSLDYESICLHCLESVSKL